MTDKTLKLSLVIQFPLLILNRSRKTCLSLQCIEVVVSSTAFVFIKVSLFVKIVY